MKPIEIPALAPEQRRAALEGPVPRTTPDVRLRTRARMVLLAAEQRMRPRQKRSPRSSAQARRDAKALARALPGRGAS